MKHKEEHYDAIIVGGGLGGLIAGAKLSKEKKVLLIEQHNVPGGMATIFKRKGFRMEVSLHEIDGLDKKDPKKKILEDLGVFDNVDFVQVPEFYRALHGDFDVVLPDSTEEAIEVLIKEFPEEARGVKKFFKKIHSIQRATQTFPMEKWKRVLMFPIAPLLYPALVFNMFSTVGGFLNSIIKNEKLKLILSANFAYYHDTPLSLSLIYFSAGQASYFNGGGHYIKKGSQELSDYLVRAIEKNGGEVVLRRMVTKILMKDGKASGVEYRRKLKETTDIHNAFADFVIVNGAIPNVADLLPEENRDVLRKKIGKLEKSCSLISVHLGLKRGGKELGNKYYSTAVIDNRVKKMSDYSKYLNDDYENQGFIFVDYSQVQSELVEDGRGLCSVCSVDYLSNWDTLSEEEYRAKKDRVAKIFIARLEKIIPGISEEIEHCEVATPRTIKRYTLNPEGSVYGFSQLPKQTGAFRLFNRSPIKNLYFASAWSNPGGGFTGAILSGWLCACEILKRLKR